MTSNPDKFRVFSCDGGGFRGYLTSLVLEKLEQTLSDLASTDPTQPRPKLGDYFETYAGTSTGSLISCGLAFGISAKEIREIYESSGKDIFPDISLRKEIRYRAAQFFSIFTPKRLGGMTSQHRFWFSCPLFDGTALTSVLQGIFGDTCLGDVSKSDKRVLVTAYDCWNSLPVIFDSHNEKHRSIKVVDVLLASSAYPGGFPCHSMPGANIHGKDAEPGHSLPPTGRLPLVDGGVVANNPALLALSKYCEKSKADRQSSVVAASFGTGKLSLRFNPDEVKQMGQLDWAFPFGDPLLDVVYGGYSRMIDRVSALLVKELCKDSSTDSNADNYFRFQPYILSVDKQEKCPSPDSVPIDSKMRKDYELATFQYKARDVLHEIAQRYLQDKDLEIVLDPGNNLHLQVGDRIQRLAKSLL